MPMPQFQSQLSVPTYQPILVDHSDPYVTSLMVLLREQASDGNLMINYHQIVWLIETELRMNKLEAKQLLLKAEQRGYIIVTVRSFGCVKNLTLISIRLQFVTLESVQWVLKGLKRDGMCPNERAIQSRIKEAFGVKISSHLWEVILQCLSQIKTPQYLSHEDVDEARSQLANLKWQKDQQKYEYQYEIDYQHIDQREIRYAVRPTETVEETETQQKVVHLYLVGERYLGQDQSFNGPVVPSDNDEESTERELAYDKIVYNEFKKFLHDYFIGTIYDNIDSDQRESDEKDEFLQTLKANSITQKSGKQGSNKKPPSAPKYQPLTQQMSSNNMSGSSDSNNLQNLTMSPPATEFNEDGKAIPGGRYGCAQFVKLCGPQLLKEQSLGKLAQMVQRSINEDYLRYQRTLLILTQCIDKTKSSSPIDSNSFTSEEEHLRQIQKKAEIGAKLQAVKCSILEVLAEHKEGVSLPQLPIYLKKKLPFKLDWNQLGFAKLKDLIMSMNDQIKLELIGPNHTLAYLIYSKRYHHTNGAYSDDLQNIPRMKNLISEKQKYSVDFHNNDYKNNLLIEDCKSLEQILALFYQMLKEFPLGIDSFKIVPWISEKLGHPFDIKAYGCQSIYEFIRKFIMPTTEIFIINNKPDSFLIRSNQIYSHVQQAASSDGRSGSYSQTKSDSDQQSLGHSDTQSSISANKTHQKYNHKNPQNPTTQETPRSSQGTISDSKSKGKKRKEKINLSINPPPPTDDSQENLTIQYNKLEDMTQQTGFHNPYDASLMSRRIPSGTSTFHMPCASSFYGQMNDDGQSQIQINISHIRTNTDGEMNSSNATQIHHHQGHQASGISGLGNQILLPQHFYNASNEFNYSQSDWQNQSRPQHIQQTHQFKEAPYQEMISFNHQKKQKPGLPPLYQHREHNTGYQQIQGVQYDQGPTNIQLNTHHQQNNSYGSSIEAGFLSFASKNNPNNPNIPSLSPIRNQTHRDTIELSVFKVIQQRIICCTAMKKVSTEQKSSDDSEICITSLQDAFFVESSNYKTQIIGNFSSGGQSLFMQSKTGGIGQTSYLNSVMPIHKEASKESSLEAQTVVGEDEEVKKIDNGFNSHQEPEGNSIVERGEDEIHSPLHSRFIEDLLEDADNTETDMISQSNSIKTTVVHTPQLSMSSFYQQLPPSQRSSYYPAYQTNNQQNLAPSLGNNLGLNRQASGFDQSCESDETAVHMMMNNLTIKVGHTNNNMHGTQLKSTQPTINLPQSLPVNPLVPRNNPIQNLQYPQISGEILNQQNFMPQGIASTKILTNEQDNAQFLHSKAMSENFSSQSLFGNHFVLNNYVNEQQAQTQRPSMPIPQQMNHWPQIQHQALNNQTNLNNARIPIELKPAIQPLFHHNFGSAMRPSHIDAPSFHPTGLVGRGVQQTQQMQLSSGIHPPLSQNYHKQGQPPVHNKPIIQHSQQQYSKKQNQVPTPANNNPTISRQGKVFQNNKKQF